MQAYVGVSSYFYTDGFLNAGIKACALGLKWLGVVDGAGWLNDWILCT